MKKFRLIFYVITVLFILMVLGCGSMQSIDEIVEEVSWETVYIFPEDSTVILSVYYFTMDGDRTKISDYLINAITSELANAISNEELNIKVVSREKLDILIDELSFQMTDFVDQGTQVSIGKQLGADVILTGTITEIEDYYKLNVQVIEVESGVVLGGFNHSFWVE